MTIADATSALETAATTRGWPLVDATEDASVFSTVGLAGYDVVVFLLTSGDVLDAGAALPGMM